MESWPPPVLSERRDMYVYSIPSPRLKMMGICVSYARGDHGYEASEASHQEACYF